MQTKVVIVGGGTAGISVAARLQAARPELEITIVEPSEHHYYQPMWTLIGGGMFPPEESRRDEADQIPPDVSWVKEKVVGFAPQDNTITTESGQTIGYDYLVVATGMQLNWDAVKGLKETVGKQGVCSNYSYQTVSSTWENIRNLKRGTALFTQPVGAVKCGGAPQKICYLAEDHFRRSGVRDDIQVIFATATPTIFAVPRYARTLEKVVARKGIDVRYEHNLVELRAAEHEAIFEHLQTKERVTIGYDMIHVTPPMGPPDVIRHSELADSGGWADVDKHTLQHPRFANVFALGDSSNLPTSKTGAAIRKQAPVVATNLLHLIDGQALSASYDGYTSCPVVTGYNSLVLAEFDYNKQPEETFPFDQSQERFSMLMLKKYGLPALYWHGMLKGLA